MGGQEAEIAKEMRREEKEMKRWDRQEQAYILKTKSHREAETGSTHKRRDNNGEAKSPRGLEGILGSSGGINLEGTEHPF